MRVFAVAGRVLRQLAHDPRSIVLMLVAPSVLVGLFAWLFSDQEGIFDRFGGPILALFPFIVMFLVTSVTTLRERRSGTLERLMTTPLGRGPRARFDHATPTNTVAFRSVDGERGQWSDSDGAPSRSCGRDECERHTEHDDTAHEEPRDTRRSKADLSPE